MATTLERMRGMLTMPNYRAVDPSMAWKWTSRKDGLETKKASRLASNKCDEFRIPKGVLIQLLSINPYIISVHLSASPARMT